MPRTRAMKALVKRRGIMLGICGMLTVLLGALSCQLARMGLEGVVGYRSPYAFNIQPGAGTERLTRRLVLVIIDGLGFSGVDEMPTLKDIGSRGVAFSLVVNEPSLSYPGWTTVLTGAPPEVSGVATNAYKDRVAVDSLFDSAARAGIKTVVAGDEGWKTLFGGSVTRGAYYKTDSEAASKQADDAVLEGTLKELKRGEAELIVAHFSSVDFAGHASGARSPAYRSHAAQADARLSKILSALDLTSTAIVVTSDHGHTARGGHGGWEKEVILVPFVAAGAGIVAPEEPPERIEWMSARHVDVAPTCAALLGISVPAHSQGVVLFDALDAPEHVISERAIRQAQARVAFGALYCSAIRTKPPAAGRLYDAMLLHNDGEYGKAAEIALQTDAEILDTMARARQRLVSSRRLVNAPASALVLGILALGAVLLGNVKAADMKIPALGAASYFALFHALVFARGITWSLSMFNKESDVIPFFLERMVDSGISGAISAAFVGWLVYQSGVKRPADAFFAGAAGAYLTVLVLAVQVSGFVVVQGVRFIWYIPDLHKAFKYYVDLLQITVIGLSLLLLGVLAMGAFWTFLHLEASRRGTPAKQRVKM